MPVVHTMKLLPIPFDLIQSGKKTIEIRLNDLKRQKVSIGDTVIFTKLPEKQETCTATVIDLSPHVSFFDLVSAHNIEDFGFSEYMNTDLFLRSMYDIYTPDQEALFGVLGMNISLFAPTK